MRCPSALEALHRAERQFHDAVADGSRTISIVGFRVHLWSEPDVFYRNVAVPVDRRCARPESIDAMASCFAGYGRTARLEFFADLWPDLPGLLDAAGFAVEMEAPALVLGNAPAGTDTPACLLRADDGPQAIAAYLQAAERVFDVNGIATNGECRRLAETLGDGRALVALVRDASVPVAGAALTGIGEVAELAGVWSAVTHRGRGLARMAAVCVLRAFFARGGRLVWLSAGGAGSLPLYRSLGFRAVGTQLNYHRPRRRA